MLEPRIEKRVLKELGDQGKKSVHKTNNDLQQPDTLTIAKGHSISLHCSYSMHNLSRFTVKWFLCNDSPYSSTVIANLTTDKPWVSHSRYCVRHNSTLKAFILTIIDVQVSDNGIYCCEVIRLAPPPTLTGKGNGTLLNVTACPSFRLIESYDKISSSPSIIITCLAYGFYPNIITFWIQPTCLTYRPISTSNSTNPNGTYNYNATFSISTENCSNSTEFMCVVQHPASQTELNVTIIIDVHTVAQDHKWSTWISILRSISGGTACLFPLVLFLIKCACKRKGITRNKQEFKLIEL